MIYMSPPLDPDITGNSIEKLASNDLALLAKKAKERRLLRGDSLSVVAQNSLVSKSMIIRFESDRADAISYISMMKITAEFNLSFYVKSINHSNPSHMEISNLIGEERKKQNKSLRDLSDLSGVPFSTIFNIENVGINGDFFYKTAISLLSSLGCESSYIQVDDFPKLADKMIEYNFKKNSGHPMFRSPYIDL